MAQMLWKLYLQASFVVLAFFSFCMARYSFSIKLSNGGGTGDEMVRIYCSK